jgi:dUTPase
MAQNSGFWDTTNTGDGLSAGYSEEVIRTLYEMLTTGNTATQGVLRGYKNELAVSGTSSPVSINTGGAVVYGFWYYNDSSTTIAIPTPAGATRIDRIVLQAGWAGQTVRVVRVAGTEGGAAPALTQTANTTWQIPLAQVSITTGGVITLTDQRVYLPGNFQAATNNIADSAVTTAKIADANVTDAKLRNSAALTVIGRSANSTGVPADIAAGSDGHILRRSGTTLGFGTIATAGIADSAVTTAKIADANVTTAKITDANVTTAKIADVNVTTAKVADNAVTDAKLRDSAALSVVGRSANSTGDPADIAAGSDGHILRRSGTTLGFGTIATAGIADGAVTTAKVADNAIDDTKVGDRVPQFYRRQGSGASWELPGTTNYTPGAVRMQAGAAAWTGSSSSSGSMVVTLPALFDTGFIVLVTPDNTTAVTVTVGVASNSAFTIYWSSSSSYTYIKFYWLAIGPE